jgi:ketosteroid isomerase-like protein
MTPEQNKEVVQQVYANFKSGNIESLLDLMSDSVEWELPDLAGVPAAGKRQGRAGVADFFGKLAETQSMVNFEPKEFVAQADKVVVLGSYTWQVKSTGGKFTGGWAHVFTLHNGKVTRFREYTDTAAVARAYQFSAAA